MYNKRDICMICVMILVSLTSFMLYKTVSFGESLALAYTGNDIKLEKHLSVKYNIGLKGANHFFTRANTVLRCLIVFRIVVIEYDLLCP